MEHLVDRSIGAHLFMEPPDSPLPEEAGTIIVGGGVIGSSIAHFLAEAGERNIVLLDANVLGSGTSWHAAGLISTARSTPALTALSKFSRNFYTRLGELSGIDVNWHQSQSLSVARTPGRVEEFRYQHDVARQCGVEAELLDADGVLEHWPMLSADGILSGLLMPEDGSLNPGYAAIAFAKLAHERGVDIREHQRVTRLLKDGDAIVGVETENGTIRAPRVVLAAGLWARELGRTVGAHLPLYAAEHVHVRSHPIAEAHPDLPVLRDLDSSFYIRHEQGRLLVGAFEADGIPRLDSTITTEGFAEFDPNWDHFAAVREQAERAVPQLADAGFERFLNAPESFTPDANFLLGETNEIRGLHVAAGMNSQGIIYAPAVGKELAAWIVSGAPQFDASSVDVRRFSRNQANDRYLHDRMHEGLGRLYAMHWPRLQMSTGRNVRRSPLHSRLSELGAAFGELNGWERANWYGAPGETPTPEYSYQRASWFDAVAEEHRAAREDVALFDLSPFAKLEVAGPDALAVVQSVFTSDLDVEIDESVYTLALNTAGGIALDCTVLRSAEDRFRVIAPSSTQDLTASLLKRAADGRAAAIFDATAGTAVILVSGPKTRELLSRVSPEDWSDEAQKYLHGRRVQIADGFAYALRVSFVGELGYEIHVDADLAVNVYDALWTAGQDLGVRPAGYFALESLSAEKGFRHLGHDIGPTDDPRSAGLWFTVDLDKGDFTGRSAIADSTPATRTHRTVHVRIDDPEPVLVHDETVFKDGAAVGRVLSGDYGHTLGGSVETASIPPDLATDDGIWEVECGGRRFPATVSRRAFYDPEGERMRG